MNIVERVKNILVQPKLEWPVIEAEQTDAKTLYTSYICILAAIPAVVGLLSMLAFTSALGGIGRGFALTSSILGYVLSLAMVYIVALIADALATSFDGQKNPMQSLKLVAYSMTASWVGGVFNIIPALGWLLSLLASLYGIFLLYTGATVMMKVPEAKAAGYVAVVVIAAIVVGFIASMLIGMVALGGGMGAAALGGMAR
jgi:hypothetical protein